MRKRNAGAIRTAVWVMALLAAGWALAGNLDPTNAPGPTMHTLEEIYQKVQNLAPQTLQTLTDLTPAVAAGYYATTNLTQVDSDLASTNIRAGVTLFGIAGDSNVVNTGSGDAMTNDVLVDRKAWAGGNLVTGTRYPAPVQQTGQTNSYCAGDDGSRRWGESWPNPRFTIGTGVDGTNCVTDNLAGLIWARNAHLGGKMTWNAAIAYCEGLTYGGHSDWRLPNVRELQSLLDLGHAWVPLCDTAGTNQCTSGDPFTGVEWADYWSSTTWAVSSDAAWVLGMNDGGTRAISKTGTTYVWPVRGGQ